MIPPDPIDLADFAEVRRRVVDPVLANLLRPGELTSAELVADYHWPRDPDERWPEWMDSPFTTRPGDAPKSLFLVLRAGQDERHTVHLGDLGFFRTDALGVVDQITESLFDWIAESTFGWGEARTLSSDVTFPPAVTEVDGKPVVLLEMSGEGRAELDVAGTPTPPAVVDLSAGLRADLDSWIASLGEDLEAMFSALARVQQARFDAEFAGRPAGFRVVMAPLKKAAAARKRAKDAIAEAHLGRWSRLVAEHEPRRDALVDRLRAELGPDFHVPAPARIP